MKNLLMLIVTAVLLTSCEAYKEEYKHNDEINTDICVMFVDMKQSDVPTYQFKYQMLGNKKKTYDSEGKPIYYRPKGTVYSNTEFPLNEYLWIPLSPSDSIVK